MRDMTVAWTEVAALVVGRKGTDFQQTPAYLRLLVTCPYRGDGGRKRRPNNAWEKSFCTGSRE